MKINVVLREILKPANGLVITLDAAEKTVNIFMIKGMLLLPMLMIKMKEGTNA